MRVLLFAVVVLVFGVAQVIFHVPAAAVSGCTANVALTQAAIQAAIGNAAEGSTVCLPSGSLTLTSSITATAAANVTVMGQTTCTGAGQTVSCTDSTTLTNNTGGTMLNLDAPTTGTFRLTGLTFRSSSCTDHPIEFDVSGGGTTYATVRIDHSHWVDFCNFNFELYNINGVADHNYFENPSGPAGANQVRAYGRDTGVEWNQATNFGTNTFNWFYFEDNRWERGISNDCYTSGRQVFRYNYMNGSGVQQHGTGHSGENRGCRAMEVYGNTIIGLNSVNQTTAVAIYSGPGMVWGNVFTFTCSNCGGANGLLLVESRQSDYTYTQSAQPGDTGYCGTNFNGTGSVFDGNTDASGYPCIDQVGRGIGDLMTSLLPTWRNNTRACTVNFTWANRGSNCDNSDSSAWPRQALEPVYEWINTGTVGGSWINVYRNSGSGGGGTANIVVNRDYYAEHSNTNCDPGAGSCTAGVGTGTRAQRPANCTSGVAWWSTDQGGNWHTTNGTSNDGTLDKCTAANTWTNAVYTPYTYPHPLVNVPTLVQHVAGAMENNNGNGVPSIIAQLPNPSLSGNALVLCVQMDQPGGVGVTIADDKSNTWTAGPSRVGTNQTLSLFYALNTTAATRAVTMTFSGGTKPNSVQASISEFYNIATASAADGSIGASTTTPIATGSFTPTTNGDLIYHCGVDDANPGSYNGSSITAGTGFTLLNADRQVGTAAQYQVQTTAAAINPSFTVGADRWDSVAIALKSASSGTAPSAGIRIVHVQHSLIAWTDNSGRPSHATPIVLQFPSSGNLLVGLYNHSGYLLSTVTDSASNTWASAVSQLDSPAQVVSSQIVYAANATTSNGLTNLTFTFNHAVDAGHAMIVLYDITGASASPLGATHGSQGLQSVNANLAMDTITPTQANGLVFNVGSIWGHTTNALTGTGYLFDAWVNPIDNNAGGVIQTPASYLDMDNPVGHYANSTTSAVTFTYGFNGTPPPTGIQQWSSVSASFK